MKNVDRLLPAMTAIMVLLAVPYVLVKTGAWRPAPPSATGTPALPPVRDPDDLPSICEVGDFSMTNQFGRTVRREDLLGQVWVADVIFTRCPGPCAKMTSRMADLQRSIPSEWPVKFVSLTADSEYDTPEVLRHYGEEYQADSRRWNFLHATKSAINNLAVKSLKLVVLDKEQARQSANDLFIHSTTLALVDKHGRLRGSFESLPVDVSEDSEFADLKIASPDNWQSTLKPRLLKAIEQLIAED